MMNRKRIKSRVALGYLSCGGCGDRVLMALPIPAYLLTAMIEAYTEEHKDCDESRDD